MAIINANDILPTNADGTLIMQPNADLFFLSGIEQEQSVLLVFPDAADEKNREILFLREPNEHLKIWEGYKHSKDDAKKISGIKNIQWLSDFPVIFRSLILESESAYLNSNEYKRAQIEIETRDIRFIQQCKTDFPLHDFRRLCKHEGRPWSQWRLRLQRRTCRRHRSCSCAGEGPRATPVTHW